MATTIKQTGTIWIYARLSRATEASTSIERQINEGRELAERRWPGVPVVVHTDDGTSGAVDPEHRKGFREIVKAWQPGDVLVFWKLDRLARSIVGFHKVVKLAQKAEVTLVATADDIDLTSANGRLIANILATFAEFERDTITTRVNASRRHLLASGKWTGGRPPYGLKAAPHPSGKGTALVRDDEAAEVIRRIVQRLLDGATVNAVMHELNDEGVPTPLMRATTRKTPKASTWTALSIRLVLQSPTIVGHATDPATGRILRGDDGRPKQMWPPVISESDHAAVLAALPKGKGSRTPYGRNWLFKVAYCGVCERPLYQNRATFRGKPVMQLRCTGRGTQRHPAVIAREADLNEWVAAEVLRCLGPIQRQERNWVEGADPRADIAHLRNFLDELEEDRKAGLYDTAEGKERFRRQYRETAQEIEVLSAIPVAEAGWRTVGTGVMYWRWWEDATPEERGEDLRSGGVRVVVSPPPGPRQRVPLEERVRVEWGDLFDMAVAGASISDELRELEEDDGTDEL